MDLTSYSKALRQLRSLQRVRGGGYYTARDARQSKGKKVRETKLPLPAVYSLQQTQLQLLLLSSTVTVALTPCPVLPSLWSMSLKSHLRKAPGRSIEGTAHRVNCVCILVAHTLHVCARYREFDRLHRALSTTKVPLPSKGSLFLRATKQHAKRVDKR